jgi:response regulator RpfG family c-di-GMP phosphodiesterase
VDLIISDMRMPGMDGAAFLAEARKRHPDAVRLLLTGYADMESTIAAINAGQIARYISKPWNDQDVLLTVREASSARPSREKARLEALTPARTRNSSPQCQPRGKGRGPHRRAENRPREAQAELPDLHPGVLQSDRTA